jgi:hypothetical protein
MNLPSWPAYAEILVEIMPRLYLMNSIGNLIPLGHYSTLEVIDHDLFVEIEVSVPFCLLLWFLH